MRPRVAAARSRFGARRVDLRPRERRRRRRPATSRARPRRPATSPAPGACARRSRAACTITFSASIADQPHARRARDPLAAARSAGRRLPRAQHRPLRRGRRAAAPSVLAAAPGPPGPSSMSRIVRRDVVDLLLDGVDRVDDRGHDDGADPADDAEHDEREDAAHPARRPALAGHAAGGDGRVERAMPARRRGSAWCAARRGPVARAAATSGGAVLRCHGGPGSRTTPSPRAGSRSSRARRDRSHP